MTLLETEKLSKRTMEIIVRKCLNANRPSMKTLSLNRHSRGAGSVGAARDLCFRAGLTAGIRGKCSSNENAW